MILLERGLGNFWPMFKRASRRAITVGNVKGGWVATGLYPLNYRAPLSKLLPDTDFTSSVKQRFSPKQLQTPRTPKALKTHTLRFFHHLPSAFKTEIKKQFLKVSAAALGAMTEANI